MLYIYFDVSRLIFRYCIIILGSSFCVSLFSALLIISSQVAPIQGLRLLCKELI